ncbi:MAG TPA: hypothetical protein VH437_13200 [Terriglobales bacterium]|jgi:hypothetical protein
MASVGIISTRKTHSEIGHNRFFSLWEIMNLFDVYSLAHILHKMSQVELTSFLAKVAKHGHQPIEGRTKQILDEAIAEATILFSSQPEFDDVRMDVETAKQQLNRPLMDATAVTEIIHRVQVDIVNALANRIFISISSDRNKFVRDQYPFGEQAYKAFPSAVADLEDAAVCIACECPTATVFHLMRASEFGLRALARDREVTFANKPLEQQEWGIILGALDGKLADMRQDRLANWPNPAIKDIQVSFYAEVIQELRGFNEAWRRHVSHARNDQRYDRDYAFSVANHVGVFMNKLGERVSESSLTPRYWTS